MRSVEPALALRWADMAEELAGVGYWWMDASTHAIRWSPNMFRIFGIAPDVVPSLDYAMQFVHPDDQAVANANLESNLHGTAAPSSARIIRPSGEVRYIEGRNACDFGPDGEVLAIYGTVIDVTARRIAELALADSEARFRLLAEAASDVVLRVSGSDVIEYVSPSIRRYGWTPDDMLGRTGASFIHPGDVGRVLSSVSSLKNGAATLPGEDRSYRMRKADGRYAWVETSSSIVHGEDGSIEAVVCQLRDVSERRAATLALAESEARYRIIADNVTEVISRADINGKLLYLSPCVIEVTGYSAAELVGASMTRLIHPDDRARVLDTYRALLAGAPPANTRLVYRARHKDGRWISIEASPTVIRGDDGQAVEFLSVTRDVSARVKLEADLRAAAEGAEAAVAVKSEFLANMSHEIRTPLTAILGFTHLLSERQDLDDAVDAQLRRIGSAGEALLAIVNDVLDFSKLEAGQVEIRTEAVAPDELLGDMVAMFEIEAAARGLRLDFALQPGLPSALMVDRARLRQVLFNLIGNAIKFTTQGHVTVAAAYDTAASRLHVDVTDTGPGLDERQIAKLFQRFSQVDGSSTRHHGGTGLGLAICKGLVEAMGGAIGVSSRPGLGSTFSFDIHAPLAPFAADTRGVSNSSSLEDMRILVADDNRGNRDLIHAILSMAGAEVTLVDSGASAIIETAATPFDAILMDIRMPDQDGPAVLQHIRRHPGPNQLAPVFAFTAGCDHVDFDPHLFDGTIRKPVEPAEVILHLATLFGSAPPLARDVDAVR